MWYVAGLMEHEKLEIDVDATIESIEHHYTIDYTIDVKENIVDSFVLSVEFANMLECVSAKTTEQLLRAIFIFCVKNDFDIRRIMENNIEKLRERYPDKFTEHDALNRDLEAETEVLDE